MLKVTCFGKHKTPILFEGARKHIVAIVQEKESCHVWQRRSQAVVRAHVGVFEKRTVLRSNACKFAGCKKNPLKLHPKFLFISPQVETQKRVKMLKMS